MADAVTPAPLFRCRNVHVYVQDQAGEKLIVKGVDLDINAGETHALMGPNGSGKSTLAAALMGHPSYRVEGEIWLKGEPVQTLSADARARRGMFLGFQHPVAVPGLAVGNFLRAVLSAQRGAPIEIKQLRKEMNATFAELEVPASFAGRYLNDGFSGGEKKRLEIAQLRLLKPTFALLDEIDSGLDIDALKVLGRGITAAAREGAGLLLVTHYQRLLTAVPADHVHVFMQGRIVKSGGAELAVELEQRGYDWLLPGAPTAEA